MQQIRVMFSDPIFVLGRCIRDRNPSKTFGTIRVQCIVATECLRMETSTIALQEKVQNPAIRRKTDAYNVLGLTRPVLEHYQEMGITINSARYSEMLTEKLKPAIRSKRRELLSKCVLCCSTIMPVHVLQPTLLKRSGNSSLK